jgi:hypothetical protein
MATDPFAFSKGKHPVVTTARVQTVAAETWGFSIQPVGPLPNVGTLGVIGSGQIAQPFQQPAPTSFGTGEAPQSYQPAPSAQHRELYHHPAPTFLAPQQVHSQQFRAAPPPSVPSGAFDPSVIAQVAK